MIGLYRRDLIGKSLFRWAEILGGASFVYVWISPTVPLVQKIVCGICVFGVFLVELLVIPKNPPAKEFKDV